MKEPRASWPWSGLRLVYAGVCSVLVLTASVGGYVAYRWVCAERSFRAAAQAYEHGQLLEARRLAEVSLQFWTDLPRTHFLLARISRRAEHYEEAAQQLDLCQRGEGATERIALERSLLLVQQGSISGTTERKLRHYLENDHPDSEEILAALSKGCMACYLLDNALGYLHAWLERRPNHAQALLWRGMVREKLQDLDGARDDYRAAIDQSADAPSLVQLEARLRLAQLLLQRTELAQATPLFEQLCREQPDSVPPAVGLAQCYGRLNRTPEAVRLLDDLLIRYPADASLLLERGRLALQMGQAAGAEEWLRKALALVPWDHAANYTLLLCLTQQRKDAAARQAQERVHRLEEEGARFTQLIEQMKLRPYDLNIRCELARAFFRQGHDQEAIRWLRSALRIDGHYPLANQLLAEYYETHGEPVLAQPYREALALAGTGPGVDAPFAGSPPGGGPRLPPLLSP
jgi:tetratricopeptide (TPR) repeat protein